MSSNILRLLFIFVMRLTLQYRLTTNKHQHWDPILCCCGYIKYVHCPWFEWFGHLYFAHRCMSRIQWWQGMRGQSTCILLLVCYTACNVIHTYIACMLLASILWKFSSTCVNFKFSCTVIRTTQTFWFTKV